MTRRSAASLLALGLMFTLLIAVVLLPVPYVLFRPGPTLNVLGEYAGKPIISVSGHKSYPDKGTLRLLTVSPTAKDERVTLLRALNAWLDRDVDVLPRKVIYEPGKSAASLEQESSQQMVSSQDNAIAAALGTLGIKYTSAISVQSVEKGGPASGILKSGDLIHAVDGTTVTDFKGLVAAIQRRAPGTTLVLRIRRDGKDKTVSVRTEARPEDKTKAMIGIGAAPSYDFPVHVKIDLDQNIGGPSAGLVFALGIYDLLTPGSLTDGKPIAGTGEIDAAGKVGEIGGIPQKIAGAERDGARLFLVPAKNCAEALGSHYDPKKLRLVRVENLTDAIQDVERWGKDSSASLPRCTR